MEKNIEKLAQSKKKIDRLAAYMIQGNAVTGRIMIERFNIYSYRDAIYDLGKKGYKIKSKTISKEGIDHKVWWLSDFTEEDVTRRNPSIF